MSGLAPSVRWRGGRARISWLLCQQTAALSITIKAIFLIEGLSSGFSQEPPAFNGFWHPLKGNSGLDPATSSGFRGKSLRGQNLRKLGCSVTSCGIERLVFRGSSDRCESERARSCAEAPLDLFYLFHVKHFLQRFIRIEPAGAWGRRHGRQFCNLINLVRCICFDQLLSS